MAVGTGRPPQMQWEPIQVDYLTRTELHGQLCVLCHNKLGKFVGGGLPLLAILQIRPVRYVFVSSTVTEHVPFWHPNHDIIDAFACTQ